MGRACSRLTNSHAGRSFSGQQPLGHRPQGEWTDHEDRLAAEWLQRQGVLVSVEVAGQAVQTAARDHPFHPVKAYLQGSLGWSRARGPLALHLPRCRGHRILACHRFALAHLGRRANLPTQGEGRLLPILEGPQGIRKSTALRTVAGVFHR
jgi:predicted P-loop ATPase